MRWSGAGRRHPRPDTVGDGNVDAVGSSDRQRFVGRR
jgi:hypothetical protein